MLAHGCRVSGDDRREGAVEIEVDPGNREQAEAWNGDEGRACRRSLRGERGLRAHLLEGATHDHRRRARRGLRHRCIHAPRRRGRRADAHGVDLSGPMIAEARLRAAAAGIVNATFEQADAQVHPFAVPPTW